MMEHALRPPIWRHDDVGVDHSTQNGGLSITVGASDSMGSWGTVFAALPFDVRELRFQNTSVGQLDRNFLVEFGLGATPKAIWQPIYVHGVEYNDDVCYQGTVVLPMFLPRGEKLSIRGQSSGSGTPAVKFLLGISAHGLFEGGPYRRMEAIGLIEASTKMTAVTPNQNALGSWVQLGTTSYPCGVMTLVVGNNDNFSLSVSQWTAELGIGESPNQRIVGRFAFRGTNDGDFIAPNVFGPMPLSLPASTKMWVRASCDLVTSNADRIFDACLYTMG